LKLSKKVIGLIAVITAVAIAVTVIISGTGNNKRNDPDFLAKAVIYEVNVRQYTEAGTFNAFSEHLPRLRDLGVDILWFMPIHAISEKNRKGTLGSYYAVADYKSVNPEFGSEADFKRLVAKAHSMGFTVILDWVANHTGWDHPWIEEHPEWYTKGADGQITHPLGTDWTDVADLDYSNPELRLAMVDAMKYWVSEYDIDGFRADVAGEVPTDFWEAARVELEKEKKLFMLAEDGSNFLLLNSAFDANYGWNLLGLMNSLARGSSDAGSFRRNLKSQLIEYRPGGFPMNFITNHDENSWNGTEYERMGDGVKAFSALYFTVPGMPLIYSGQEVGLNKRLAFFEKDQIEWQESEMTALYSRLSELKEKHPALWNGKAGGDFEFYLSGNDKVLSFIRSKGESVVVVLINTTASSQQFTIDFGDSLGTLFKFSDGFKSELVGKQSFELAPWQFEIYSTDQVADR
jgi:glycosidase